MVAPSTDPLEFEDLELDSESDDGPEDSVSIDGNLCEKVRHGIKLNFDLFTIIVLRLVAERDNEDPGFWSAERII